MSKAAEKSSATKVIRLDDELQDDNLTLSTNTSIDEAAEKRLLRKLDLTIYPILYLIYLLNFLDRVNIGNAKIQGLTQDLGLTGSQYNIALFITFVPYILVEVPSNMIVRRVRPSLYLGGLMFVWGIINMCMGFVNSYGALVGLRFLLGIFEGGVMPCTIYLTSVYYKRHELQKRMSFFFSSTVLAGAIGGLLAYGIARLGGDRGYAAWRWIFIIEGAITACVSILAVFVIADWPEHNRYLTTEEKNLLRRRLALDTVDTCRMDTLNQFSWRLIWTDYKIWLSLAYLGLGTTGLSVSLFLPSILSAFGWVAIEAQARTIPVYVVAAAGTISCAWLSDRLKKRYPFIMLGTLIASIGYIMLFNEASLSRDAKYAAVFLVTLGGFIAIPIPLGWLANNVSGHWKRAFGAGIQIMIGNMAGIIGSNIFLAREAPRYQTGYGISFALLWLGALSSTVMWALMRRENKKRNAGERNDRLGRPEEEVNNMGDYHPSFRFTL